MMTIPETDADGTKAPPPASAAELPDLSAFQIDPDEHDWLLADELYRLGDSDLLEKMLKSHKDVPRHIRLLQAEDISRTLKIGRRKPKDKAFLSYKQAHRCWKMVNFVDVRHANEYATEVAALLNRDHKAKNDKGYLEYVTASEVRVLNKKIKAQVIAQLAAEYGVKKWVITDTVKRFKPLPLTTILKLQSQRRKKR